MALDAKTGKVAWEAKVADWKDGYYMTMAPLVVKGKVLVGVAGGEFGVRGFVEAFDAETGKSAWKTYTIPAPGEPGSETWQKADTWKTGGASTWMTGNYDPVANVVYWGTGNGSPWFGDQRPGDNLYTSSTVALDGDTGKIKGHFQYHQNESWDWDAMNAPMLVDFQKGGANEGPADATAQRLPLLAEPQQRRQHFLLELGSLRPAERLQEHRPEDRPTGRRPRPQAGDRQGRAVLPRTVGRQGLAVRGLQSEPGMVYIPTNENHCNNLEGKVEERVPGQWWTGVAIPDFHFTVDTKPGFFGALQAYDVNTGKRVWRDLYSNSMNWGSVLTTGGGLLFAGGTNDRMFRAYDAKTGEELWHFRTNSGIIAPPSTFEVNGVQYVAVASGYGVDPAFQQTLMADLVGWNPDVPQGGVVWVFAVQK